MSKTLEFQAIDDRGAAIKVKTRFQAQSECIEILFGLAESSGDPEAAREAAKYVLDIFNEAALEAAEKE